MHATHRRFLVLEQGIGSAAFNLALNAGIACALFHRVARVPFGGLVGIASDTVSTAFMLPFSTCVVVTYLVRRQVVRGRVPPLAWTRSTHPALLALGPAPVLHRALLLGAACLLLVVPAVVAGFCALRVASLSFWQFVVFKGVVAAVLAGLVTPLVALWALASPAVRTASARTSLLPG